MSENNEKETDIGVDFASHPIGDYVYAGSIFGLEPAVVARSSYDEENDRINITVESYGTDHPAELLETLSEVFGQLASSVAVEQERLQHEAENGSAKSED